MPHPDGDDRTPETIARRPVAGAGPGMRPPRMADVARVAGVSHQTVSRVLNDFPSIRPETRQRVLEAIALLGYRPQHRGPDAGDQPVGVDRRDHARHEPLRPGQHDARHRVGRPRRRLQPDPGGACPRSRPTRWRPRSSRCSSSRWRRSWSSSRTRGPAAGASRCTSTCPSWSSRATCRACRSTAGVDQVEGARLATAAPAGPRPRDGRPPGRPDDWLEAQAARAGWRTALQDRAAGARRCWRGRLDRTQRATTPGRGWPTTD